ncbi:uncharacterized protein LOC141899873 isoform X2 [Tubulanus polymorphus]|uniref:uncharacterized protein LOC141899873 isoform X2 n=1 Tax=Tubulanus polymorphus TaxID=672921 RepID=UPI003DA1F435
MSRDVTSPTTSTCTKLPITAVRRKRHSNFNYELPFPVPISSIAGVPQSITRWNIYSGYLEGSCVVVKHTGDKQWLYKMGFFGKGNFSRSQPSYDHQKNNPVPRIISKRRYLRHLTWSQMSALRSNESQIFDDPEVKLQVQLNATESGNFGKSVKQAPVKSWLSTTVENEEPLTQSLMEPTSSINETACGYYIDSDLSDVIACSNPMNRKDYASMNWDDDEQGFWNDELNKDEENAQLEIRRKSPETVQNIQDEFVVKKKNILPPSSVPVSLKRGHSRKDLQLTNCEVLVSSSRTDKSSPKVSRSGISGESDFDTQSRNTNSTLSLDDRKTSSLSGEIYQVINTEENRNLKSPPSPFYQMDNESNGDILVHADTDDEGCELATEIDTHWRLKRDPYPLTEDLYLLFEEAMNLRQMWQKFCEIHPSFVSNYVVYHYLRSKGWVPKPGLKYGCEFVVYKQGPPFYHSSFSVKVLMVSEDSLLPDQYSPNSILTWTSLSGFDRLTEHVAKDVMLCYVIRPSHLTEDHLKSPKCISGFKIKEYLLKRWVPSQERANQN